MNRKLILHLLSTLLFAVTASAREETLTLAVRFHLTDGVTMSLKGRAMDMWVTPEDIEKTILPEVNRIWKQANILFVIERNQRQPLLAPQNRDQLLRFVEGSKRGDDEAKERKRTASIDALLDPAQRHATAMNVHLFPFIGSTYQGYAKLGGNHAVVAVWTDKASKGKRPPVKTLLVEPEPMKVGSLARTIAHELGHNLGLNHPPKDIANPTPSIMGGSIQGYGLTRAEIEKARAVAQAWRDRGRSLKFP